MSEILHIHETFTHDLASTRLNGEQLPFTQVRHHREIWKCRSGDWENGRKDGSQKVEAYYIQ